MYIYIYMYAGFRCPYFDARIGDTGDTDTLVSYRYHQ